ncbi:uncharacterized protein BDV14DRAFT_13741 [Aspergillus stella-maris]|uniref:uncharacterized protein n=1 Tax=Aspergillus stella-maris TaxID=1810926 RepID=UPI003CCC9F9A
MRWTKKVEETLWQTIFNTQTIHLELDKISEGWPEEEKPTPKALKEHLQRYRKAGECKVTFSLKSTGAGSVPATPKKRTTGAKKASAAAGAEAGTESPSATPKKRGTPAKGKGTAKGAAATAAQDGDQMEEQTEAMVEEEQDDLSVALDGMDGANEDNGEDEAALESPTKRVKMEADDEVLEA